MTIAEFSREHGVTMRALRLYEQRKLITPYRAGRMRYYSARESIRLQLVLKGKRLGLTLSEIEAVFDNMLDDRIVLMTDVDEINVAISLRPDKIGEMIKMLEKKRDETDLALADLKVALRKLREQDERVAS